MTVAHCGRTSGHDSGTSTELLVDPDEELLRSLRAGAPSSFEVLQRQYSRRLFKQIIAITQNREDAEDALQDTFLQAFRHIHSFEGRSRITTWLTKIAINTALMKVRKRRSRAEVSFERPPGLEEDSSMFDLEDLSLSPEQEYIHSERLKHVVDAVEKLNPILRVAVIAWFTTDCSMHEAADLLDKTLVEEEDTDALLTEIAENEINLRAEHEDNQQGEEEEAENEDKE